MIPLLACQTSQQVALSGGDSSAVERDTGSPDTALPPPGWLGTGTDGPLFAEGTYDLGERGHAPAWPVRAMANGVVTVEGSTDALQAGDEILLVDLHGSEAMNADVGRYAFAHVYRVDGVDITLDESVADFVVEEQAVVIQRVPQFTDVTVTGLLTASPWDGERGGIVAFRANGTVSVADGAAIAADAIGYLGGETGSGTWLDGFQGESWAGHGQGGGTDATFYNEQLGWYAPNHGGGGANITGGGGEHAGGATPGEAWYPGSSTAPAGGEPYGTADLSRMYFGSGGGGVWNGNDHPGPGGNGGGIVFVAGAEIVVAAESGVRAVGGPGLSWSTGSWSYGAGGGAGGTIWLVADTMTLVEAAVDARGGPGMWEVDRAGGDGGYGRIRLDVNAFGGVGSAQACEPDPGHMGVPQ